VKANTAFAHVVEMCAEEAPDRPNTWINAPILNLYSALHRMGHAHSIECWEGNELVGGLYGVSLKAAFFGESMFSRRTDASKVALVHLVARLRKKGFRLLDTQFVTPHLLTFGVEEIGREEFHKRLDTALWHDADFGSENYCVGGAEALQVITQTS
jgi:leucyl/phenylalanyl-tRNA---protein transferase